VSWFEVFKKHVKWAEGYSTTMYLDSKGIPTIGIGHNMRAKPLPPDWKEPLSDDQISILFEGDTLNAIEMVMHNFGDCFGSWTDNRKAAIVDLSFCMGGNKFRDGDDAFGPTFAHIRKGEWEDVARHLEKTQWFRDVKRRGPVVVKMIREV
jgi:lysozyme